MNEQIANFILSQLETWDLAAANYQGLRNVLSREIPMNGFKMLVQFNPERIRSSAAKVDEQSIRERKCFLCTSNLPPQQKGLPYNGDHNYTILINPYPIFPRHLTIPDNRHTDQLISGRIGDMLRMAEDMQDFVIFYNGPKCGASAPDHFHFQAGSKGLMPIESDYLNFTGKRLVLHTPEGDIFEMEKYLRKVIVLDSVNFNWLVNEFERLLLLLKKVQPEEVEPMLNILAFHTGRSWVLLLFPRIKHRPSQFFDEGDNQILFSPASVDFGGLLITPRETDFHKLDREIVSDMFSQLTFTDDMWNTLIKQYSDQIQKELTNGK